MASFYAFGNHADGQLGLGGLDVLQVVTPTPLKNFQRVSDVVKAACGARHSLFLLIDGSVYSCGSNDHGQLGHDGPRTKPYVVSDLRGIRICQVACGASHSMALSEDGHLYSWGSNEYRQLGIATNIATQLQPTEINLTNVIQIACGDFHCLALTAEGKLYSWGRNDYWQLGLGHNKNENLPKEVRSLAGLPLRQIAAGEFHSVVLSVSGALYAWGYNEFGQLGLGDNEKKMYPTQLKTLRYQKIISICCGADHTAALTKDGRLFTFGAGTYGQLGHGNQKNEFMPKQVMELTGSKVVWSACGRCHTLVLVGRKVYAFGLGGSGQLGLNGKLNVLTPNLINGDLCVRMIFAGGDHSFALCTKQDSDHFTDRLLVRKSIVHLTSKRVEYLLTKPLPKIASELEIVFSNCACLNYSFLRNEFDHFGANKNNSGVAMDDVMASFELLNESSLSEKLMKTIADCLEKRLFPHEITNEPPDIETLRVFIILPWCPVFSRPENYKTLHLQFAKALLSLKPVPLSVIESWWTSFEIRHFNRILRIFKQVVVYILNLPSLNSNDLKSAAETNVREQGLQTSLEILSKLNKINGETQKLPFDSFYIVELPEKINITDEYVRWIVKPEEHRFNFCKYPFIFNATVKTMLLSVDTAIQIQTSLHQTQQWNIQQLVTLGFGNLVNPFFHLHVSRNNIVHDTVTQLLSASPLDLRKPLKVEIRGEEAEDAGGVKKEFFIILFQELLNAKYGMFQEYPESRYLWLTDTMFEEPQTYQLVGILCGLAIYNSIIVPLPFPLALYKKILDHRTTLEDLKELSPTEGRSLEALLDYENDDFEQVFDLNFEISVSSFGVTRNIELKPGGAKIAVVKANRHEYVDLYVDYKLNKSVQVQFDAFNQGFHRVVVSRIMNFFQPQELMEMTIGNENFDWDEFEKNTEYKGEYWRYHPTIKIFWNVFRSLTLEQRKKFLLFLTGSDRVPLLGMQQLKIIIQPTKGGDNYYPVAHTCFNLLDLPKYENEDACRSRLLETIEHTQGFTLV